MDGTVRDWNRAAEVMFGYSEDETRGRAICFLTPEKSIASGYPFQEATWLTQEMRQWHTVKRHKSGKVVDVSIESSPIFDQSARQLGTLWVIRDITLQVRAAREQQRLEDRLRQDALTDPLTGVANRRRLEQALEAESSRANRHGGALSLVLADVDNLKSINDDFGHAAGDSALCAFAGFIQGRLRACDFLARLGGDEFLILMPDTTRAEAHAWIERVRGALQRGCAPMLPRVITASFGVSEHCSGERPTALLKRADQALYAAKRAGRNRTVSWSPTTGAVYASESAGWN